MPRAHNKDELIKFSNDNYKILIDLINSFSDEEKYSSFPFDDRDKNIKDVLIHLYEWHQLLLKWITNNLSGINKPFLLEPYNWKTYQQMNIKFWEKHQNTTFDEAFKLFKKSHNDSMTLLNNFSNEELFTPKFYNWTGNTSLGSYAVSSMSSHYEWAIKKIKKYKKSFKKIYKNS